MEIFGTMSKISILNMDFAQGQQLIKDGSIDLVFTDPPYTRNYLYTYQYLADFCPRMMKRGASLMCIVGHYALEEVMGYFNGKLKFRWILNMDQSDGPHPRLSMGIEVMWKPILWYVKDAFTKDRYRGFIRDSVKIDGKNGYKKPSGHEWEQDLSWAMYYIEKLTKPGETVLDPYVGSGTVPHACHLLGRNCIGFDIEKTYTDMAIKRLLEIGADDVKDTIEIS